MRWTVNSATNSQVFEETMKLALLGYDLEFASDAYTCMKEILNNARIHGNRNDPNKLIYMCVMIDEKRKTLECIIKDQGFGFDYCKRLKHRPEPTDESGRGLTIMFALANEIIFDCSQGGTQVYFLKKIPKDIKLLPKPFQQGDKVIYEGKTYDFGYMGTGKAIIYEEGCRNMQDSIAVDLDKLQRG